MVVPPATFQRARIPPGELLCPRGDLNPETREISPDRGKSCRHNNGLMPTRVKPAGCIFDM